jgi:hypothetical protein
MSRFSKIIGGSLGVICLTTLVLFIMWLGRLINNHNFPSHDENFFVNLLAGTAATTVIGLVLVLILWSICLGIKLMDEFFEMEMRHRKKVNHSK